MSKKSTYSFISYYFRTFFFWFPLEEGCGVINNMHLLHFSRRQMQFWRREGLASRANTTHVLYVLEVLLILVWGINGQHKTMRAQALSAIPSWVQCPRSCFPFYIVSYYIKLVTISCTYNSYYLYIKWVKTSLWVQYIRFKQTQEPTVISAGTCCSMQITRQRFWFWSA